VSQRKAAGRLAAGKMSGSVSLTWYGTRSQGVPSTAVLPLGRTAQRAVEAYQAAGGVVEYVLIDVGAAETGESHRAAAISGLEEIARRWEAALGHFHSVRIDPELAVGSPIPLRAFIGRAYDWDTGQIVSLWTRARKDAGGEFITDGYAEAFSDPPYGVHLDFTEINALFEQINRELLGGLEDTLDVWQWSTDWSSWFEPGSEWWGAYLWTAAPADCPWITVIAASATD
jgi:hypothetical protein